MRFFYLRDVNGHAIGCIASDLVKPEHTVPYCDSACSSDPREPSGIHHSVACKERQLKEKSQIVKFAVSVCNPIDSFSRSQARHLAAGRIATGDHTSLIVTPEMRGKVKWHILESVANDQFPQRARDAAKRWLAINRIVGERFTAEDYKNGREGTKINLAETKEANFGKRTSTPATSSALTNA